jgi:C1A family cysteine protease
VIKIKDYKRLQSAQEMKEWLASSGSLVGCFVVYEDFFWYGGGIYHHEYGDVTAGHCVEIVGYNDADGCWICKNSWGAKWEKVDSSGSRMVNAALKLTMAREVS